MQLQSTLVCRLCWLTFHVCVPETINHVHVQTFKGSKEAAGPERCTLCYTDHRAKTSTWATSGQMCSQSGLGEQLE